MPTEAWNTGGRHVQDYYDSEKLQVKMSAISDESKTDQKAENNQLIVNVILENNFRWVNVALQFSEIEYCQNHFDHTSAIGVSECQVYGYLFIDNLKELEEPNTKMCHNNRSF